MKDRVAADAVMHVAGRENVTFITGLRSSRRNTATVRFARVRVTSLRNLDIILLNLSMNNSSSELTAGQCF